MRPAVSFSFHEDLNVFLEKKHRNCTYQYVFEENSTVKDSVEVQGVPHTEIDWLLVNGELANFGYRLQTQDYIEVYPASARLQHPQILRPSIENFTFLVDFNVRKITKYLRMLGFPTVTDEGVPDHEIAAIAVREQRIILTRDIGLLKRKNVEYGYFLRNEDVEKQMEEVVSRYNLLSLIKPFSICLDCNGGIETIAKMDILELLPIAVQEQYNEFYQCKTCQKIYWKGSHFKNMQKVIDKLHHPH